MNVGELRRALDGIPDDRKVVIDVDTNEMTSDRNVIDLDSVRNDDVGDDVWMFLQAASTEEL